MFPMTITIHTVAQFHAAMRALQPDLAASDFASPEVGAAYVEASARVSANEKEAVTAEPVGKPKAEKTAPATVAETEPAANSAPTAAAEPAAAPETKADESAKVPTVTYEDVKKMILKISTTKGRETVVKLLKDFGVQKGPDLEPGQFAAFLASATVVLQ